ncbi:hypothetical protein EG68_05738 [Paragonimus skrjabini miyazakii]|uniref:Uncharacterized protein n=1 Tax=Paragonimus skrjabini miyazakii TaxID=59628 RepID=A0A8S9YIU7_9TREM|nr:hypothetical protein EG68_05738 [Paragonimus skrjabini miyazakii]
MILFETTFFFLGVLSITHGWERTILNAEIPVKPSISSTFVRSEPQAKIDFNWSRISSYDTLSATSILLANVTQSYGFTFLKLMEYDGDAFRSNPGKPFYFANFNWSLDRSTRIPSVGESFEMAFLGNGRDAIFLDGGHVELRFTLVNRSRHQSSDNKDGPPVSRSPVLKFEISLVNLRSNVTHGQFGLQLGLVSNESVLLAHDYETTTVRYGDEELVTVNLGRRVIHQASNKVVPLIAEPSGFIQGQTVFRTSITDSRATSVVNWSLPREPYRRSKKKHRFHNTLPAMFFGERMNQQYAGLDSIPRVYERWMIHNGTNPPPVGIRLQNFLFGNPLNAPHKFIRWRGYIGIGSSSQTYEAFWLRVSSPANPLLIPESPKRELVCLFLLAVPILCAFSCVLIYWHRRDIHKGKALHVSVNSDSTVSDFLA